MGKINKILYILPFLIMTFQVESQTPTYYFPPIGAATSNDYFVSTYNGTRRDNPSGSSWGRVFDCGNQSINWNLKFKSPNHDLPSGMREVRIKIRTTETHFWNGTVNQWSTGWIGIGEYSQSQFIRYPFDNQTIKPNHFYRFQIQAERKGSVFAVGTVWRKRVTGDTQNYNIGPCENSCKPDGYIIDLDQLNSSQANINLGNYDPLFESYGAIEVRGSLFNGESLIADASTMVELKQGFHAKVGSNFIAYIDGCDGRAMRTSNLDPDPEIVDEDKVVEDEVKSEVKIYPNPSSNGKITIDLTDVTKSHLLIYSLDGRIVKEMFGEGKTAIDLSHLKKGIYLVKITSQEKTIYKRIMLN